MRFVQYEMKLADLLRLNDLSITSVIAIGQKIKVNRRIPMLEIMAQKLEEKSAKTEPKKTAPAPKEQDIKVEVEEVRNISSVETDKSFYIRIGFTGFGKIGRASPSQCRPQAGIGQLRQIK